MIIALVASSGKALHDHERRVASDTIKSPLESDEGNSHAGIK